MIYDELGDVTIIRSFHRTNMVLGVRKEADSWFVVDCDMRGDATWHTHCGPYSTPEQAAEWINAIREDRR
jgi:hypothetical protein